MKYLSEFLKNVPIEYFKRGEVFTYYLWRLGATYSINIEYYTGTENQITLTLLVNNRLYERKNLEKGKTKEDPRDQDFIPIEYTKENLKIIDGLSNMALFNKPKENEPYKPKEIRFWEMLQKAFSSEGERK